MIAEQAFEYYMWEAELEQDIIDGVWTNRDGERMYYSEMTDSHLYNTISMLLRTDWTNPITGHVEGMQQELESRGWK